MGRRAIGRRVMTNAQRQARYRKAHKVKKGRRTGRPLKDHGYYPTSRLREVKPLDRYLPKGCPFVEPCGGGGDLIGHLVGLGHPCAYACDISPQPTAPANIVKRDALTLTRADVPRGCLIVTNPPHQPRKLLNALIVRFSDIAETWLLLDVNWLCIAESRPLFDRLRCIVPVGHRPQWWPGTKDTATQDFVWLKFGKPSKEPAVFCW